MYRFFEFIKQLFIPKKSVGNKLGSAYAVTTGKYVGEVFIYISEDDENAYFLSIPKMLNREVPLSKLTYAIEKKVIEYVQRIPRNERVVCKAQYEANAKG